MELNEFLAENPSAKIQFDGLIAAAEKNGREKAEAEHKAVNAECVKYLASAAYGDAVKNTAISVLKGEARTDTLIAVVAAVDAVTEKAKSDQAKEESKEHAGVHGEAPDLSNRTPEQKALDAAEDAALAKLKAEKEAARA